MRQRRVVIQWTDTAIRQLTKLPPKVRRGLWNKADALRECDDPRTAAKRLVGPLEGYYRIVYSRYRAIFSYQEEELANGETVLRILIRFVAVGIRKEGDKRDVYRFAMRLLKLGALDEPGSEQPEQS